MRNVSYNMPFWATDPLGAVVLRRGRIDRSETFPLRECLTCIHRIGS
jgi:hypothetical protein